MPANLITHCIHRSNCRADAPKLPLNDSLLSSTLLSARCFSKLIPSSSCLHSGPNSPTCSSPSSPSGWFLSSLSFPLFLDPVHNESQFHSSWSLHPGSVFLLLCGHSQSHWLLRCTRALPQTCFASSPPAAISLPVPASLTKQPPFPQSLERASLPSQDKCPPTPLPRAPCLSTSATSVFSCSSWKSLLQDIGEVRHFHEVNARSQQKKLLRATWVQVLAQQVRVPYSPRG